MQLFLQNEGKRYCILELFQSAALLNHTPLRAIHGSAGFVLIGIPHGRILHRRGEVTV